MNTAEILAKAADVIDERGWQKGASVNPYGGTEVCTYAAMCLAVGLPPVPDDETPELREAADAVADWLGVGCITTWNDWDAESAEQVTSALRECAASLSGGAS